VLTVPEVTEHPQFVARGDFVDAAHPTHGRFRQTGPVLAGQSRIPGVVQLPDPSQTDTDMLLRDAGYTAEDIARLREEGAVA
jgi:crotonobetainyl-CoA:carnitine CoA-transferase CaiB-like acyl-CoA transferase